MKLANSDLEFLNLWPSRYYFDDGSGDSFTGFVRGFFKPLSSFPELSNKILQRFALGQSVDGTEEEAQKLYQKSLRGVLAEGFNKKIENDCNELICRYIKRNGVFPENFVLDIDLKEVLNEPNFRDGSPNGQKIFWRGEVITLVANKDFTIIENFEDRGL